VTDDSPFLAAFAALPFERPLREFLADVDRPPQDSPTWLVFGIKERIGAMPSDVRQALPWRIRGRRRGPWRQLKRHIAERAVTDSPYNVLTS